MNPTLPQRARDLFLRGHDTKSIAEYLGITEAALCNAGWHRASYKPPTLVSTGQRLKGKPLRRYAYGPFTQVARP